MNGKTAVWVLILTAALTLPCLAQHEPVVVAEGTPLDDSCWWAYRLSPSGELDKFYFSTAHEGMFSGILDTERGDVLYYSLQVPTAEQKAPPPEGGNITIDQPLLIEGDLYFVARNPEIGSLYVGQIEEGELWLFRSGDTVFFKKTPFVYGEPPLTMSIELTDEENNVVTSVEIASMPWQLAEARTSNQEGETMTLIRFIGAASSAEEFGNSDVPDSAQWQEVSLENGLGVVQVWSRDGFADCRVEVRWIELGTGPD